MKIFIGCGSSNDIPKYYFDDCRILLSELLKDNDLVYGAYNDFVVKAKDITYEDFMDACYKEARDNKEYSIMVLF